MFSTTLKQELQNYFKENVSFDAPLSDYTSIHIGGPADAIIWPMKEEEIAWLFDWCREKKSPYYFLGKGSNTLVRDGGVRGCIINLSKGFHDFKLASENGKFVYVEAQGGVPTQQLLRWCVDQGFCGIERLAGVPGTIGGNVAMNAGTYLGEIGDILEEVTTLNSKGKIQTMGRDKLKFEYRSTNIPPSSAVLNARLKLSKGDKEKMGALVKEVFEKRGDAQPIEKPNLGSVFKNPGLHAQGKKKAWELIEEVGLKGVRVGGARVSEKHGNFIVNEGNAKAKDVLILISMIKERVKQASGIQLETEVKVVGEEE